MGCRARRNLLQRYFQVARVIRGRRLPTRMGLRGHVFVFVGHVVVAARAGARAVVVAVAQQLRLEPHDLVLMHAPSS